MIPKTIHYCWFGRNPKPKLAEKCIKSWKKYCPDYEIIEWNEDNYDISAAPLYVQQAYEAKKWAFVTDYVRFDILYLQGGVYFDTDVEIVRPIDDILTRGAFMGCEKNSDSANVAVGVALGLGVAANPGLGMAANPGLGIYKEILDSYSEDSFIFEDGSYNYKTIVERTTEILVKHGLQTIKGIQNIDGINIYPSEYFCPVDYKTGCINITKNTRTIHWFSESWLDEKEKERKMRIRKELKRDKLRHLPNRVLRALLGQKKYEKLKKIMK